MREGVLRQYCAMPKTTPRPIHAKDETVDGHKVSKKNINETCPAIGKLHRTPKAQVRSQNLHPNDYGGISLANTSGQVTLCQG